MGIKSKINLVAFDLDGTIYNGNQLISGSLKTIDFFIEQGKEICFFTNNSSNTRTQIFNKLRNFSINLSETDVYCCSYAIQVYLREEKFKNLYIIGSNSLMEELSNSGINIVNDIENKKIDALLIGMDIDFNYSKLAKAYEVLQRNGRCKIIVCNMDYDFPIENGMRKPGCGAIVSSILAASKKDIDFMIGKPNTYILDLIRKEKNVLYENMLIIGDSFESDIFMANKANAHSILIDNSGSNNSMSTVVVNYIYKIQKVFEKYYL